MHSDVFPFELGTIDYDAFCVSDHGTIKTRTGAEILGDIGASPVGHLHDGQTLQNDGLNSNGGNFAFNTTGRVTFSSAVALATCINAGVDTDKFLVLDPANNVDFRTGLQVLGDIGASPTTHRHDGQILQHDAVNSNGGAFSFNTTGAVTFNQLIKAASSSTFGTLVIGSASITDPSGTISFGNENLVTTGTLGCGAITATGNIDTTGNDLILDVDGDTYIHSPSDDIIRWVVSGSSQLQLNTTGFRVYKNLGVGVVPVVNRGINADINYTGSINPSGVFGGVNWTPANNALSTSVYGLNFNSWLLGTKNVNFVIGAIERARLSGSGTLANMVGHWSTLRISTGCTRTITEDLKGYYLDFINSGGATVPVGGDGYQMLLEDYSSRFPVSGIGYGIVQRGAGLINVFKGDLQIDGDNTFVLYGSDQDAGDTFDGTNLIRDYDLSGSGTTDYRIQENGTDVFTILSGGDILTYNNIVVDKAATTGIKVDTATPTFGFADLLGEVFTRNTGASKPTRAAWKGGTFGFQFAAGKNEEFEFHIPHDYVKGTNIFLHIHWGHNGTLVTGGTCTFDYEMTYAKGHGQGVFGNNAISTIVSAIATTAQYSHELSEAQVSASGASGTEIDTDDLEPDGVIKATIGVNANNLTVSSGGVPDPFIHYVDIHYQSTGILGTKSKVPDFYN